ncbi:MAG: hypothetical protein JOZ02_21075 [Acidobacteria bacterium]|nr:hypothetical protein [Acidobacteriota bacterium]
MLAYLYQLCLVVFLLQGFTLPLLPAVSGALWWRLSRRLEALRGELQADRRKGAETDEAFGRMLARLPKLRPLNCESCGGAVLLREDATLCPYCGARGRPPEDYAAALRLKAEAERLLKSAVRHWRVANLLTHPLARWTFLLLIFAEPLVLFPAVVVGSNVFPDAPLDRAFAALGEGWAFLLMLSSFLGFVVWMVVFIFLAGLSKSLRVKLPVVPVFEGAARGRETASCQACGGAVEYDAGAFACLCGYCNVENFRARFVRRERVRAERQGASAGSALFGAAEIIEEFLGTFFFVLLFLAVASILLTLFLAFKKLL